MTMPISRVALVHVLLVGVALSGCKKSEPQAKPTETTTTPGAVSDAGPAPDAAAAATAPAAGAIPRLEEDGIGGFKTGFTGGLAELKAALPGLDIKEAWLAIGEGEQVEGYEIKQADELLFTLLPDANGTVMLETTSPKIVTADNLHTGSKYEELAAVARPRKCEGINAEGYFGVCTIGDDPIVYELALDKEPPRNKAKLEKALAGKLIETIRWSTEAKLAVPKLGAQPPP
jgi:hypothetical protein